MDKGDTLFIKHLHAEKLKAQESRSKFVIKKLLFATVLLGAGSASMQSFTFDALLYIVPFVALVFDLYILGEDYGVKRMGTFIGVLSPSVLEKEWERWVSENRDIFSPVSMPILTSLISVGAFSKVVLFPLVNGDFSILHSLVSTLVFSISILCSWGMHHYYKGMKKRLKDEIIDFVETREVSGEGTLLTYIQGLFR